MRVRVSVHACVRVRACVWRACVCVRVRHRTTPPASSPAVDSHSKREWSSITLHLCACVCACVRVRACVCVCATPGDYWVDLTTLDSDTAGVRARVCVQLARRWHHSIRSAASWLPSGRSCTAMHVPDSTFRIPAATTAAAAAAAAS